MVKKKSTITTHDREAMVGNSILQAAAHMRSNNMVEAMAHALTAIQELNTICQDQEDRLQLMMNK